MFVYKMMPTNMHIFRKMGCLILRCIMHIIVHFYDFHININRFRYQVVPDDASKLADFQKVVQCTSQFETVLKDMDFISASDKDERLSNFADNVEVHFASRKKVEILAKARNLLLRSEFTLPQVSLPCQSYVYILIIETC